MGVHGLWRLIGPSGRPVPLETLDDKILAIDVSIWLHQAVKGMQDSRGAIQLNAHLLSIFHRICKLLYFRIRPVFVFDGGVPSLKKETIVKRNQLKTKNLKEVNNIQKQLLSALVKHSAISSVLSETSKANIENTIIKNISRNRNTKPDIYELPSAIPALMTSSSESDDDSTDVSSPSLTKTWDLHTIDEKSEQFKSLPADVRHEILSELKDTRKQSSWGRVHELPTVDSEFSSYQMSRLLKRYSVQLSLEEAEKEMGGRSLSMAELESLLKDQGVVISDNSVGKRIASNENKKYIFIKDVKKALESAEKELKRVEEKNESINENVNAKDDVLKFHFMNKGDTEFEQDLQAAIQLSLQEAPSSPNLTNLNNINENSEKRDFSSFPFLGNLNDADFESDSTEDFSPNSTIANKILTCPKSYMTEYSGLGPSEIEKFVITNSINNPSKQTDNNILKPKFTTLSNPICTSDKNKQASDSDDSDDFVEVSDQSQGDAFEIVIHPDVALEDDLFDDIFANEKKDCNKNKMCVGLDSLNGNNKVKNNVTNCKYDNPFELEMKQQNSVANVKLQIHEEFNALTRFEATTTEHKNKNEHSAIDDHISQQNCDEGMSQFEQANKTMIESTSKGCPDTNLNNDSEIHSKREGNSVDNQECSTLLNKILKPFHSFSSQGNVLVSDKLKEMESEIIEETDELISRRLTKERLASNITDQMYQETQELLELFGIPYIVAPMEAEAQCAYLNEIHLTDGTITDDSDIWLFGGGTVYKNFFNQSKLVMEYKIENIESIFKLTRHEMILLALLVGSDYTTGLQGIGPVTALEILSKFPIRKVEDRVTAYQLASGLRNFKRWLGEENIKFGHVSLRNKLKKVTVSKHFPNIQVVDAYLEPKVDKSKEKFSWSTPNVVGITDFAKERFGWSQKKTEDVLKPVMKRIHEKHVQKKITNYFNIKHKLDSADIEMKMSKRVKIAVNRIRSWGDISEEESKVTSSKKEIKCRVKSPKRSNKRVKKIANNIEMSVVDKGTTIHSNIQDNVPIDDDAHILEEIEKFSKIKVTQIKNDIENIIDRNVKAKERTRNLRVTSKKKEVIPQKEMDKISTLRNKMKAIEVFRKSKNGPGYVRKRNKSRRSTKEDAELSENSSSS